MLKMVMIMSNLHRITWFDQEIRANNYPNSKSLARKFEISVRQASRDIDYLKNSMGAPLVYVAKQRGFEYEDKTYLLPNVFISEEEKKMLSYLAYRNEQHGPTEKTGRVADLFKKLAVDETGIENNIPVFEWKPRVVDVIYLLKNAIQMNRKVWVAYQDPLRGKKSWLIAPYQLFRRSMVDYLVAVIEGQEAEEVFRLDSILELQMTKEMFVKNEEGLWRKYGSESMLEPFVARVQFVQPVTPVELGLNMVPICPGMYDIEFFDSDALVRQLIGMTEWSRILSPRWLREKLKKRCFDLLQKLDAFE
jgi:predicted DNA-binding transcriptional regulator YafY